MTEEQKAKYKEVADSYPWDFRNGFLAGTEHAHPIGYKEGYNQALTDVYELLKVEGDNVKYHNQIQLQQLIKLKR